MRAQRRLPAELEARPFTASEAGFLGVSHARISARSKSNPFHGIHATTRIAGIDALCRAYSLKMRGDGWFSGVTAARLWGVPLPDRLSQDERLHVSTPLGTPAPRGRGVIGHRGDPDATPVVTLRGLRVLSRSETWCELAAVLDERDLVIAADALLTDRRRAAEHLAALTAAVERPRRRHRELLRRALLRARPGVRSPRESLLRLVLVDGGLPEPAVNARLHRSDGSYLAEGDLVYVKERLVLEYEGDHHRRSKDQFRYDIRRREQYVDAGWDVIRVTADDLGTASAQRDLVERVARRLGAAPTSSAPAAR